MTEVAPEATLAPTPPTGWGRKSSRSYLLVCALAMAWMIVEWSLGKPGGGSILSAILALPWSLLVARMAPPPPESLPLAAQFGVRAGGLALLMLLNAAIVYGIAGRFERDLARK